MSNIRKYILVILLGIIFGLSINFANNKLHNNVKNKTLETVNGQEIDENCLGLEEGIRILALKDSSIHNKQFTLNLNKDNDFDYTFKLINTSNKSYNFDMKIYLNYNEVDFKIRSQEYIVYNFNLKGNSEIDIPVKIHCNNLKDSNNVLILNIKNTDKKRNSMPYMNCRYNLTNNKNRTIKQKSTLFECDKKLKKSDFYGIYLNYDILNDNLNKNGDELEKKVGEKLKIPVAVQGKYADNCLIWVTSNNRQVKLNNNNSPFINLKLQEGYISIKYLDIEVPKDRGKYELQVHVVFNPWLEKNRDTLEKNLEMKISKKVFLNVK